MGHALAKPSSGTTASREANPKNDESNENNKKAASMTTKRNEGSFRLLTDLHSDLQNILELLEKHDVRDFRLERGEERISLKRGKDEGFYNGNGAQALAPVAQPVQPNVQSPNLTLVSSPNPGEAAAPVTPPVVVPNKSYKEITSPMVGSFYRRPAVDADPYVVVGDMVKKGDVLCIVEAMKLMNEIESDVSGKVVEICLEDAQMVEYGEVLFRIEPV